MTSRLDNFTDAAFAFAVPLLATTGIASILVSMTPYGKSAAMLYATLPISIGLFLWRYDWTARE